MRYPTHVSTDDEIIQYLKDVVKEAEGVHDGGDIWSSHGRMRGHLLGLIHTLEGRASFIKEQRDNIRDLSERTRQIRRDRWLEKPLRDA